MLASETPAQLTYPMSKLQPCPSFAFPMLRILQLSHQLPMQGAPFLFIALRLRVPLCCQTALLAVIAHIERLPSLPGQVLSQPQCKQAASYLAMADS